MERKGWKIAVGKSCGQAEKLGKLQVPSCRSHAVSSSGFSTSSYSHTLQRVSFRFLAISACILVQRGGWTLRRDPCRTAPGPAGAEAGERCRVWHPGNEGETCHAAVCPRQMEAESLFWN